MVLGVTFVLRALLWALANRHAAQGSAFLTCFKTEDINDSNALGSKPELYWGISAGSGVVTGDKVEIGTECSIVLLRTLTLHRSSSLFSAGPITVAKTFFPFWFHLTVRPEA
eukprot:343442-Ditylum_brightwellii.AAC.1